MSTTTVLTALAILAMVKVAAGDIACGGGHSCLRQQGTDRILRLGSELVSENKKVKLRMKDDGNLVVACTQNGRILWESYTEGRNVKDGLKIQADGNMVLYASSGQSVPWASNTHGNHGTLELKVQDDSNVVLYNSNGRALWNSGTYEEPCPNPPDDYEDDDEADEEGWEENGEENGESGGKKWRDDGRCGANYPLSDGTPAQCDPYSNGLSCCSRGGWCGGTSGHCSCDECIDYSRYKVQEYNGKECTNPYTRGRGCDGWSGISKATCIQYCRENKSPKSDCPPPAGGCMYAGWNERSRWCQLTGDNCSWRDNGNEMLADTKSVTSNTCERKSLGCWKDNQNNRAIEGGKRFSSLNSVKDCENLAAYHGFSVFAVQNDNECYTAADTASPYKMYGASGDCQNGRGGALASSVYKTGSCPGNSDKLPMLIIYNDQNQQGEQLILQHPIPNLAPYNFDDKTESVEAVKGNWELYQDPNYGGRRFFVQDGQKIGAKERNDYSSARPANCQYVSDPTTAQLRVYSDTHLQGDKQTFLTPQTNLGDDWSNKIKSAAADKGDWELYQNVGFEWRRLVIKEGQQMDDIGYLKNDVESLRPICETYKGKKACGLINIEIMDAEGAIKPRLKDTEIIGSQSSGSCYGPAIHELTITQVSSVEESTGIELSREDEINWDVTASASVEVSAGFLGSGSTFSAGLSVSAGGAVTVGTSETKETTIMVGTEHAMLTEFWVPGAGIVFGVVDRYQIDESNVPAKMHLQCPDGESKTVDTTVAVKQISFGTAHFWSLQGKFTKEACALDRSLPDCVENVRKQFSHYIGQKRKIEEAFEKCFADGKGTGEFKRALI